MSEKEWFKYWFNSKYYHILYNNRDEHEAEEFIGKLTAFLQLPAGAKVLDVACGKGRHSKTLVKLGYVVNGIDLSENSIAEAREYACDNLHFDVWDMREVYKAGYFDCVVNLFSSFGYLPTEEDNEKALQAMAANLKPDGLLVLDYLNAESAIKQMKPREIIERGETQFHIRKRVEAGFIKKQIEFVDAEGGLQEYEEQLRIIKPEQFRAMFEHAGLRIEHISGDYGLNAFESGSSPRQIIIARLIA
jgi:SAM-dependent methyltransferase